MPCKTISAFFMVCELLGHSSKLGGYSVKQSKSILIVFLRVLIELLLVFL